MDNRARNPGAPADRPREPLASEQVGDRTTPVASASIDYRDYIDASRDSRASNDATMRLPAEDLQRLRDASRHTTAVQRAGDSAAAAERAARPPRKRSRLGGWVSTLLGVAAGLAVGGLWLLRGAVHPAPSPVAPSAAVIAPAATVLPAPVPAPATATAVIDAVTPAESQARAALERLRGGLGDCIRRGIRGLPGSSPAVPSAITSLRGGAYRSAPAEWKTAVWSCAHFQMDDAMRFQLQWQLLKPGTLGQAIAWIDGDGDGTADRALAFHVTLDARGEPVLGDVAPAPASQPVLVVR